jgi:hypothetical protein
MMAAALTLAGSDCLTHLGAVGRVLRSRHVYIAISGKEKSG